MTRHRAHPPLAALLALIWAAGCTAPTVAPDTAELRNIRDSNIVPKSPPARLASTFAAVCLDGPADRDAAAAALRAMDYVEWPGAGDGMRSFVVDDSRPAVMLDGAGRACAVAAQARTGQTERLRRLIADRFPAARALSPPPGTSEAWATGDGGLIALRRTAPPGRPAELLVLWLRPGAGGATGTNPLGPARPGSL
ncbi:MAG: hypothetical protein IE927_09560 [Rhodobacterales bacterium]|nr:hypothetical protein [Rhodobacterales bacterium]